MTVLSAQYVESNPTYRKIVVVSTKNKDKTQNRAQKNGMYVDKWLISYYIMYHIMYSDYIGYKMYCG